MIAHVFTNFKSIRCITIRSLNKNIWNFPILIFSKKKKFTKKLADFCPKMALISRFMSQNRQNYRSWLTTGLHWLKSSKYNVTVCDFCFLLNFRSIDLILGNSKRFLFHFLLQGDVLFNKLTTKIWKFLDIRTTKMQIRNFSQICWRTENVWNIYHPSMSVVCCCVSYART